MTNIQFGYFLPPDVTDTSEVLRRAQVCDRVGYDLIGIQDHPYQRRFLDAWTLLAFVAGKTERVRIVWPATCLVALQLVDK